MSRAKSRRLLELNETMLISLTDTRYEHRPNQLGKRSVVRIFFFPLETISIIIKVSLLWRHLHGDGGTDRGPSDDDVG